MWDNELGGTVEVVSGVRIFSDKRHQGLGTRMYDQMQDQGVVNLYNAIGQSHSFTAQGREFAVNWLQHRVQVETARNLGTQLDLGLSAPRSTGFERWFGTPPG